VGAALTVNAKLELGEVSQVVEVTASALIESTQPNPDALIGVRPIQELPINGRRFHDFVTLTPTVQIEPLRSGISFSGQRGINGNVTIDGADYNEPFFGGIRGGERAGNAFTIPQEAISQFQVVSYGYSVEFGRSTGGIMNVTSKSGTNDLHGSAFFFARNAALAVNDAFRRPVVSNLYQEGGSIGARIRRDRAFFFAAFEDQKNDNPRVVVFRRLDLISPDTSTRQAFDFYKSQETPFTQTNDAVTGFGRLDFQLNSNHHVAASYHYSKNTAENAVAVGNQISPETDSSLSNNGTEGDRTNTVVGQWTAIFSPRLIMETRGQYSLENRQRLANSLVAGITTNIGQTGTRSFFPTTLDDWRTQISSNLTWTHGLHAVKFGGEFNFLRASQFFKFNQFGVFNFRSTDAKTLKVMTAVLCPTPSPTCVPQNRFDDPGVAYSVNIGNGLLTADTKQLAFFIQDTWRVTSRFTLTAGFRWEGYVNPQPATNNTSLLTKVKTTRFPIGVTVDPSFIPSNYRQYMPHVGMAWDPRGNAKTVIRANAGFFYAPTPLLIFAAPLNNFRIPEGGLSVRLPLPEPVGAPCRPTPTSKVTIYCELNLIGINLNTFNLDKLPTITPDQITAIAKLVLPGAPNPFQGASPIVVANNYESPRSWQWAIGFEHELARGFSVGADFSYVSTVHLQRNLDVNLPQPCIVTLAPGPCQVTDPTKQDLSLRPCFGAVGGAPCSPRDRPIKDLSNVTVRMSNARSLYRGFTVRTNYRHGRAQFQTYYTLSKSTSDDDNERNAIEFFYDNPFNLAPEKSLSRLDARHMFGFNGLVDLPFGFTVSALGRFRSGRPVDPGIGFPVNGADFSFMSVGDRAFKEAGVPFQRNSFRDRSTQGVDLRVAKKFRLPREGMQLWITADFFNLFNFKNIVFTGGSNGFSGPNREYGPGVITVCDPTTGACSPKVVRNDQFLRLRDPSFCAFNDGCYDTKTFPSANGSIPPFTVQLGIRFQF
jgi:hypothetical protein